MPETPKVEVGQVWSDNDPRSQPRKVQVIDLDATHATVRTHTQSAKTVTPGPKRRRIRLDRFVPTRMTGYTLLGVEDIPEEHRRLSDV